MVSPRDHMIPRLASSTKHHFYLPKKSTQNVDSYYDQQSSSRLESNNNNKVSITETSNMPSPIIESRKVESKLFNGHDKTRPNTYREIVR